MSEGLRARDVITKPRVVFAAFLASVAFAGCGNTKTADSIPVGACGDHDYSKAGSTFPIESASQVVRLAQRDVTTLQQRALHSGGFIDMPRYDNSNRNRHMLEVEASKDSLTLSFDRSGALSTPRIDHVVFPIHGENPDISKGAVICSDTSNQLVVNGTYTTLQQYVHQTDVLGR